DGGGADVSAPQTFTITVDTDGALAKMPLLMSDPSAPGVVKTFDRGGSRPDLVPDPGYHGAIASAVGGGTGVGLGGGVTGALAGHVKVVDGATGAEVRSFLAFPGFAGGVSVASADVDGDGLWDLVVGAGSGPGHVKVLSGKDGSLLMSFFAFPGYSGAVSV